MVFQRRFSRDLKPAKPVEKFSEKERFVLRSGTFRSKTHEHFVLRIIYTVKTGHPYILIKDRPVQIFIIRQLQIKSIPYLIIYWKTKYQMKIFFIWKKKKKSNWLVPLPHISKILFQKPVSSGHLLKNITGNTILPFRFFHATIMQMKRSTQRIYNF